MRPRRPNPPASPGQGTYDRLGQASPLRRLRSIETCPMATDLDTSPPKLATASTSDTGRPTRVTIPKSSLHHIVIVGGGAAGLELATKLGDSLGRHKKAEISLVERARTHIWKPHLHEVTAGTMH